MNQVDYIAYLYGGTVKSKVREVVFQVTSSCNLQCSYCYERHKGKSRMSLETGKKIIDLLINQWEEDKEDAFINKSVKSLVFTFIGGEPFLEVKLIDSILEYFLIQCAERKCELSKGFQIGIATNGVNYFNEHVQNFLEKYKNFLNVTISIDGIKELHDMNRVNSSGKGSFDKAFQAFEANKKYGRQHTKMTFVPESFQYISDSIIFMLENNVEYIAANCAYEPVYTPDDAKLLYSELKKVSDYMIKNKNKTPITILDDSIGNYISKEDDRNYCGGTGELLCFAPDGIAYPCIRFAPISVGEEKASKMKIGDCNGIYLDQKSKDLGNYLNSITRTSQSTEECINCPIASGCGWCSGYNYEVTGDVNKRVTSICWAHRGRVLASCYFSNKKFLILGEGNPKKINIQEEIALQILSSDEWELLKSLEEQAFEKAKKLQQKTFDF